MPCGSPNTCLSVMPGRSESRFPLDASPETSLSASLKAVTAELDVAMGSPERVRAACARLRGQLGSGPSSSHIEQIARLLPFLGKRIGPVVRPLFDLFDDLTVRADDPWPLLKGMLAARDKDLVMRALDRLLFLAEAGAIRVSGETTGFLAGRIEMDGSVLADPDTLERVAAVVRHLTLPDTEPDQDPAIRLYLQDTAPQARLQRRMAARILDLKGEPVALSLAEQVLGRDAGRFLWPYLAFTRATYSDLMHLAPVPGAVPPALSSLQRAEAVCGNRLLRELIAEIGWERLNLGVDVQKRIGISIGKSFPFVVSPAETTLFRYVKEAKRSGETWLFVAHGGRHSEDRETVHPEDPVSLFRAYNLLHADALAEILSLAPLTREATERILDVMDRIVYLFMAIFSSHTDECSTLSDIYGRLRERVAKELDNAPGDGQISPELTRLVKMFENPGSLDAVRTLHGLKRYLHQRGLDLGFCLLESGRATNRTVTLATADSGRILGVARTIRYVDFEPEQGPDEPMDLPYPVSVLVREFARRILHGHASLPDAGIFCYGNEVHYYLSFQNHPAFVRVDYSPPLKGGMIDLTYYGVSKKDLDRHPAPSLEAVQAFLRAIGYEVQAKDTRIRARYDKERALSLEDLCRKAEALFRLAPYLMEIDWAIGSLDLPAGSRQIVADAWSGFFTRWGVLPIHQLLTRDRRSVLVTLEKGPKGDRETVWTGRKPYCDRFSAPLPPHLLPGLQSALSDLGLKVFPYSDDPERPMGQIQLEDLILRPLREAVALGEITETDDGFTRTPPNRFKRVHEAERFAEIVSADKTAVAASASLARLVAPLEQTLRFQTTGRLNGYEVQSAPVPVMGRPLTVFAVRDPEGMICLAMSARDRALCLRRKDDAMPWRFNGSVDPSALAKVLWRNPYLSPGMAPPDAVDPGQVEKIQNLLRQANPARGRMPSGGETVVKGLRASPGRAVGRVLLGTEGRRPGDFKGYILAAPSLRPQDNPFLYYASGIISTGGGILSHAGLTAIQFQKPALIIPGEWHRSREGAARLVCSTVSYQETEKSVHGCHISIHSDMHARDHTLREGDLVVLNADEGDLQLLGQGRDTLAFHEDLHALIEATRRLGQTRDPKGILILRGRRLRSRHQIEKLLSRLTDPGLASHAVRELVLNDPLCSGPGGQGEQAHLLAMILKNRYVGRVAHDHLLRVFDDLKHRCHASVKEMRQKLPSMNLPCEILWLRLRIRRLWQNLEGLSSTLRACGLKEARTDDAGPDDMDRPAEERLQALRKDLERQMEAAASVRVDFRVRHLLRQVERLDRILETPAGLQKPAGHLKRRMDREETRARDRLAHCRVLTPGDGGFELAPFIGWKAANLAEVERLAGRKMTPPWIVIADCAFQEVLDAFPGRDVRDLKEVGPHMTLRQAIASILGREDMDAAQKSVAIRHLWERTPLPGALVEEVITAYRQLTRDVPEECREDDPLNPYVAVRSSSREEDLETAARAGEFDTFLFIRGERPLLDHMKKAWSGLWTERAIHNRMVLGMSSEPAGGGVIIQRNARSRVSGVLQTVNLAEGNLGEMVINAGLGLGEGIVSGVVAADHIVVNKEGIRAGGPLRFRYTTADKEAQAVFDKRTGLGTVVSQTLYHQRLRPALEYMELHELVKTADQLEAAYGYPLDIEFGIEGSRLWILQARPVVTFLAAVEETVHQCPLAVRKVNPPSSAVKEMHA